jgi:type IV pilus assembly protein PilV
MIRRYASRGRMSGISMVEALVALVVISVGMLGIAGLYLASLKAGRTANLRVQAVNLVSDMADRIRANPLGRVAYETAGYGGATHACVAVTCTPQQIADNDLGDWATRIDDALRNLGAVGEVDYFAPAAPAEDIHRFEVRMTWREAGDDFDSTYFVMVEVEE